MTIIGAAIAEYSQGEKRKAEWNEALVPVTDYGAKIYFVEVGYSKTEPNLIGMIRTYPTGLPCLIIPANPNQSEDVIMEDLKDSTGRGEGHLRDIIAAENLRFLGFQPVPGKKGQASKFLEILDIKEELVGDFHTGVTFSPSVPQVDSVQISYNSAFSPDKKDSDGSVNAVMRFHNSLSQTQSKLSIKPVSAKIVDRYIVSKLGFGLNHFLPEPPAGNPR
jgi:hypothetical protein